jgi:hypothetical protein
LNEFVFIYLDQDEENIRDDDHSISQVATLIGNKSYQEAIVLSSSCLTKYSDFAHIGLMLVLFNSNKNNKCLKNDNNHIIYFFVLMSDLTYGSIIEHVLIWELIRNPTH